MTARFRLVAGPNGSGKTTLMRRLAADYAVNFYDVINADDIFAEVSRTGRFAPRIPLPDGLLKTYAATTSYPDEVKRLFGSGTVSLESDCVRFAPEAVNSYSVALLADFLQDVYILHGASFSRETVFSHPSKVKALESAKKAGFRTYLYFVATESASINVARVGNRAALGGHSVSPEKITSRFPASVANAVAALSHLSRAFFFDNSGETMRFFAEWSEEAGLVRVAGEAEPGWFAQIAKSAERISGIREMDAAAGDAAALSASAAAASRDAVARAFAAGLPITVMRDGRIVRLAPEGKWEGVKTRETREA